MTPLLVTLLTELREAYPDDALCPGVHLSEMGPGVYYCALKRYPSSTPGGGNFNLLVRCFGVSIEAVLTEARDQWLASWERERDEEKRDEARTHGKAGEVLMRSPTPWSVGSKVGRTIYKGHGPDDLIGTMDTREDAAHVVACVNATSARDLVALQNAENEGRARVELRELVELVRAVAYPPSTAPCTCPMCKLSAWLAAYEQRQPF